MNGPSSSYDVVFSLGYRCSSSGILKSLGLKTESYPFDWMVSRLPIIEHCIQNDFKEFLDPNNYNCKSSATYHYPSIDPSSQQWICNESICFNEYYQSIPKSGPESVFQMYLPRPISPSRDAYGYNLMMNHRNIKNKKEDQEYFARCVERWNRMYKTPQMKTLSLYIHPATFYEDFLLIKSKLIEDIRRFHRETFAHKTHDGIYVIPVKTPFEYPTNHCAKYVLEEQPDDSSAKGCRICILWANREFIDAGEIFMGNCYVEIYVIQDYLQKIVNQYGL